MRARSMEALIAAYWKPVYTCVRLQRGRSVDDAMDLTQGFFAKVLEKDYFAAWDPARGRFRTFLRTCLDAWLANEGRAASALKRGGEALLIPLEFESEDGDMVTVPLSAGESPERAFEREWVRSLFGLAVDSLRADCAARGRDTAFLVFERYDLEEAGSGRTTYAAMAAEFGITETTVTNYLCLARREFRRLLVEKLRELTATDEEFRLEARALFGRDDP